MRRLLVVQRLVLRDGSQRQTVALHPMQPSVARSGRYRSPAELARWATDRIRRAGYTPLEPYPGHADTPWKASCDRCGTTRYPTVTGVLQDRCQHVRREMPPPRRRAAAT